MPCRLTRRPPALQARPHRIVRHRARTRDAQLSGPGVGTFDRRLSDRRLHDIVGSIMRLKAVLDTNVLVAAFAARGVCAELLEHCVHEHRLFTSEYILAELRQALVRKLGASGRDGDAAVALLRTRLTVVEPVELGRRVCRDAKDDPILGTAAAAHGDVLVTGDKDPLEVGEHEAIRIVSPRGFWSLEAATRGGG